MDEPLEEQRQAVEDLARAARGDALGLERLFRTFGGRLSALGLAILKNRADAEEVLHEVFLEAWRVAADYDPARGTVRSWLMVRMRSRSLDRLKSKARREIVRKVDPEEGAPLGGLDDPSRKVDQMRLASVLPTLSPEHREVLWMGYFEGLSSSEMAERLALPLGTIKSRVRQALMRLREIMGGQEP